jgi:tetratricopeptide (TPR) repeat protein/predicted Ser/Thr protein kinase
VVSEDTASVSGSGDDPALAPALAAASTHVDPDGTLMGLEQRELETPARVGRFRVLDELGRGGMGVVLSAYDEELDRKVAIKLVRWDAAFSEAARARMKREARAMARLSHPNVVQVYDVGELDDRRTYLAMEYVRGQDLDTWLIQPRSWQEVLTVFRQCGEGLLAAHRVGLVHRDFKPSNAMIDRDGRVRVLDFGLARGKAPQSAEPSGLGPLLTEGLRRELDLDVTRAGAVVGTPAYMAPEQHEGREADARSDQFSFCMAFYEALYGERAYPGSDRNSIYEAIVAGQIASPPANSEVPDWLREAVVRGLARDPDERWPSFEELLAALRPEPRRRRWLLVGAAIVLLAGFAGALGLALLGDEREGQPATEACDGAREQLRGVWDATRKAEVEAAFAKLGTAYADQAGPLLSARLDSYATAWADMHREACEARRRGEHSEQLLDRRMTCLRHRRTELGALVDRLAAADEALARDALRAAAGLPDLGACADLAALAAQPDRPEDPAVAARVDALRDELSRAVADELSGRYDEAQGRAREVVDEALALGYGPLEAEARLRLAFVHERKAEYEDAKDSLLAAYLVAEESAHELIQAEAASLLSFVVGVRLADVDGGEMWAHRAEGIIEKLGEGGEAHAQLLAHRGALDMQRGELEQAVVDYQRTLTLMAESRGPDHPKLVAPRLALGAALGRLGRLDEARAEFEAALAQVEANFGDLHPTVAAILNNLGTVAYAAGDLEQALAHWQRALSVYEDTIGLEHPEAAATLNNIGSVQTHLGNYAEARRQLERALAIRRASLGDQHPLVAAVINNLAVIHAREGEHAKARDEYARALAMLEASHGPNHPSLANALDGMGVASVELGDYELAIEQLERAEALGSSQRFTADRARAKLALAQALWAAPPGHGRDRVRARDTMHAAFEIVEDAQDGEGTMLREQAQQWLAEHEPTGASR